MESENESTSTSLEKKESDLEKNEKDKIEKQSKKKEKEIKEDENESKEEEYVEEDEFNVPLAAMEEEIKPHVISTIEKLCKNYSKLLKYQKEHNKKNPIK